MEEKQELNNILLDQNETSQGGSKKYLLMGAGLVLLFLVVLAVMKVINSSNEVEDILPPEPSAINSNQDDKLFENVAIKEEPLSKDKEFDKIVQSIRENSKSDVVTTPEELNINEKVVDVPQNKIITPKVKEVTKPKTVRQPKVKVVASSTTTKGHYIQVGAFYTLKPDQTLLNKIEKNGFKYYIHKTKINGKNVLKVLVGPYSSTTQAKKSLPNIRKTIQKGAYVFSL